MKAPIRDTLGGIPIPQSWVTWFETVDNFIRSGSSSGTTANRPTKNLFVGLSYMDTTLGKQIQIQSLNPTVWVDSAGDDPDVPAAAISLPVSTFVRTSYYASIPAGRQSLFVEFGNGSVEITTQTQVRCVFGTRGVSGVGVGLCYATDVLGLTFSNVADTTELTASDYFNTSISSYQQIDTDWLDLAEGVSGIIFPNFWTDGNTGAESIYIDDATFFFK